MIDIHFGFKDSKSDSKDFVNLDIFFNRIVLVYFICRV